MGVAQDWGPSKGKQRGLLLLFSPSVMPLFHSPVGCSPPGSSVHGISQARIQEWVAISFSRDLSNPGIKPVSPALVGRFFTTEPPGKPFIVLRRFLITSMYIIKF